MATKSSVPEIPHELLGKWIAWDREQTQIVGWGDTFAAARHAAGQAGWREVMIAKSQPPSRWLRGQHLLCVAAVFISQASDTIVDFGDFGW